MNKQVGRVEIKDKSFRIYIPKKVRELLDLKQFDEIIFEYDGEKITIWKNLVKRSTIRKISQVKM